MCVAHVAMWTCSHSADLLALLAALQEAAAATEPLRTALWGDHQMAVLLPPGTRIPPPPGAGSGDEDEDGNAGRETPQLTQVTATGEVDGGH